MTYFLDDEEIAELWDQYLRGETTAEVGRLLGRSKMSIIIHVRAAGGIRPSVPTRAACHLRLEDREEISRGLASGQSFRQIARTLQRAPSTISREVAANGGRARYRASRAERTAVVRRKRPKVCKLAATPRLQQLVEAKLEKKWSPEQITGWLKRTYPDDAELQVSHETIYRSLFIQSRGVLKRELTDHLRTRRTRRRPANSGAGHNQGRIANMVNISSRPAEVADRAIPGHWEGDLIVGPDRSAIGTLVERSTRFVVLVQLEGMTSEKVIAGLQRQIVTLPQQLWRSLTWDQGKEMSLHTSFTIDTGIEVYFCDPRSPWQRGTNENTNGLLRQYFPKRTDLKPYTQFDLDIVAAELNGRPRKTLEYMTPSEKFAEAVAATH